MPELLGSLLLRKGLLTKAQLDAGLAAQARHKGRLGTNLVELRFLSIAQLGAALLEQRGGTLATKDELDSATANVLVSKRVAKLHLAVPIRVENRVLLVAMASAWDADAVDALERELRSRVQAKLAPELVVLRYLDRIYDVKASRPVSVYDHPLVAEKDAFLSSSGFLTDEGNEAVLNVATATPAAPMRPMGPPSRPSRPGAPAPGPQPHIESRMDELLRAAGAPTGSATAGEDDLEELEPLPDDLPVLAGTALEGPEESAGGSGQVPPAVPPDIPDEWK